MICNFIESTNLHKFEVIFLITILQAFKYKQMGPKKKADPGAEDNAQKVQFLENKVQSLQYKIVWQTQRADRSKISQDQLRKRIVELDKQFTAQKTKLSEDTNILTQKYNETQSQLKIKVDEKRKQLVERQELIVKSKQNLRACREDYQKKLKQKQKQLSDLRQKMEDMSIEFSRMLRQTLQKMQERIQLQQWDNQSDPQLIKKMKDLSELYSS